MLIGAIKDPSKCSSYEQLLNIRDNFEKIPAKQLLHQFEHFRRHESHNQNCEST